MSDLVALAEELDPELARMLRARVARQSHQDGGVGVGVTLAREIRDANPAARKLDRLTRPLWDGVKRLAGSDLARRAERFVDKAWLRDADPVPHVRDGYIVWRSRFGPRKHELVLPDDDVTARAWERAKRDDRRPTRLLAVSVGKPSLVHYLASFLEEEPVERDQLGEAFRREDVDLSIVDAALLGSDWSAHQSWLTSVASCAAEAGMAVMIWLDASVSVNGLSTCEVPASVVVLTELPSQARALRARLGRGVSALGPIASCRPDPSPAVEASGIRELVLALGAVELPESKAGASASRLSNLQPDFSTTDLIPPAEGMLSPEDYLRPIQKWLLAGRGPWAMGEASLAARALALGFVPAPASCPELWDELRGTSAPPFEAAPAIPESSLPEEPVRLSHLAVRHARRELSTAAAMRRLCVAAALPCPVPLPPVVSVLCVSNRPERLGSCLETYARQSYSRKELVLVVNADVPDEEQLDVLLGQRDDVTILRTRGELSLGESLNRARSASSGELWTKMDDDDYYGENYLRDQVDALMHSEADVVGKGTFFTYVEGARELYLTPEAPENALSERYLHGGTILARRAAVLSIDFPAVRRGTDTLFLQQCKLSGLKIYSTDRFNFAYVRYAAGGHHTFDVGLATYLKHSRLVGTGLEKESVDV